LPLRPTGGSLFSNRRLVVFAQILSLAGFLQALFEMVPLKKVEVNGSASLVFKVKRTN